MTVAEVGAIAQAFHEGVARQDAAMLASLYAENGRFLPPNMEPCEGRDEIESAMQILMDMGARSLDVEPLDVREAGELTIEYGRYTLGLEPPGAAPMTDVGKYMIVHESQPDGSTKIVLDCFNSNSPPPGS
jgi:ketosteroid isomerase-like protein